jgi:hypothetical protein
MLIVLILCDTCKVHAPGGDAPDIEAMIREGWVFLPREAKRPHSTPALCGPCARYAPTRHPVDPLLMHRSAL